MMNQSLHASLCASLQNLYASNETARALLDQLGHRKRDFAETSAPRAAYLTETDYYDMVAAMKALADAGAGTFIPGRHGRKSRIAWAYSARSLAAAARGEGGLIEVDPKTLPTEEEVDGEAVEQTMSAEIEGDAVHEFQLRPGRRIRFSLPENLTQREAERLAGFVQSLPYEDAR